MKGSVGWPWHGSEASDSVHYLGWGAKYILRQRMGAQGQGLGNLGVIRLRVPGA